MGEPVKLEQLASSQGETFRELYAIYAASIAAREQKREGWIAAMIDAPEYRVWVAKARGLVRGFSILFVPAAGGFALLEYMAVAPEHRNHGLGAGLFRRTVEQAVTSEGRTLPVLLEVDSDREASIDRALRTRREGFYRRLGCLRIAGLRYLMPLAGDGPPPEMDLLVYTARPLGRPALSEVPRSEVTRSQVKRWLETIYRDVYHCSPDDPRLAQMVAGLPDPVLLD
ncbi:MAG TPA: GNAT family N-acetyltransferase [Polyangia bacterium]|nr:GNAT family N-acetyltransferase [Polyangia bacterium]